MIFYSNLYLSLTHVAIIIIIIVPCLQLFLYLLYVLLLQLLLLFVSSQTFTLLVRKPISHCGWARFGVFEKPHRLWSVFVSK